MKAPAIALPLDTVILLMILVECVPTYEYECRRCSRRFEVRQRISEPALSTCEHCGGPVQRLLAAAPFILKGGGWYVTDYPSEDRKKALSSESAGKPKSSDASDAKAGSEGSSTSSPSSSSAGSSKASSPPKESAKPASS
jgi:putative FmdB family regulatory protein